MCVKDVEDRSNTAKGCNAMYVEDIEDRPNTPKGCNAMYVEDVEDGKRTYTHILAFQSQKSFGKLRLRAFQPSHQILCMLKHVKVVEDYLRHALIYTVFDGMVGKP